MGIAFCSQSAGCSRSVAYQRWGLAKWGNDNPNRRTYGPHHDHGHSIHRSADHSTGETHGANNYWYHVSCSSMFGCTRYPSKRPDTSHLTLTMLATPDGYLSQIFVNSIRVAFEADLIVILAIFFDPCKIRGECWPGLRPQTSDRHYNQPHTS